MFTVVSGHGEEFGIDPEVLRVCLQAFKNALDDYMLELDRLGVSSTYAVGTDSSPPNQFAHSAEGEAKEYALYAQRKAWNGNMLCAGLREEIADCFTSVDPVEALNAVFSKAKLAAHKSIHQNVKEIAGRQLNVTFTSVDDGPGRYYLNAKIA